MNKLYCIKHKEGRKWLPTHIEITANDNKEAIDIYCKFFNCDKSLVKAERKERVKWSIQ